LPCEAIACQQLTVNNEEVAWLCNDAEQCCPSDAHCVDRNAEYRASYRAHQTEFADNDVITYCAHGTENKQKWVDCDAQPEKCDGDQNDCAVLITGQTGVSRWVASGEGSAHGDYTDAEISTGDEECCSDDTNEYFRTRECYSSQKGTFCESSTLDEACCSLSRNCVFFGTCYHFASDTHTGAYDLTDDGRADAICGYDLGWVDCDNGQEACSRCDEATDFGCSGEECFVEASEAGVGEYDSQGGGEQCCGDDTNEEYRTRELGSDTTQRCKGPNQPTNECPNFWADADDKACCDEDTDCVYAGTCVTKQTKYERDAEKDKVMFCSYDGEWRDCDVADKDGYQCRNFCELKWVASGEENVGEYDSLNVEECCGDDANEVYEECEVAPQGGNYQETMAWESYCTSDDYACCGSKSCINPFQAVCHGASDYHHVFYFVAQENAYAAGLSTI
jgi:hypothetical protein